MSRLSRGKVRTAVLIMGATFNFNYQNKILSPLVFQVLFKYPITQFLAAPGVFRMILQEKFAKYVEVVGNKDL